MCNRSYKLSLRPTSAQTTSLHNTLEVCRVIYNKTLYTRKLEWETHKKTLSKYDTNLLLTQWKKDNSSFYSVYSTVLQNVQERVDLAFRDFFQRTRRGNKPGYPRFKGIGRYDSFCYPKYETGVFLNSEGLYLAKIGRIDIVLPRSILSTTKIKRVTIKREQDKWFAIFSVEEPDATQKSCGKGTVGIDLGCKTFITLSDGTKVENPKFLYKAMKKIAKAQRKLQKQKKGTPERLKARKVIGKVYQKVNNQRSDFLHNTSRSLVNKYETLVFEDLKIQDMLQSKPWHSLNRTIMDASWDKFVFYCSYKAENAGGRVITVNPKNTSKMCSRCGALVDKDLSERTHSCPHCGLKMDRDLNASINILRLGQKSLAVLQKTS